MEDKKVNTNKQRAKMEFKARITMPDGRVVEKTVEVDGGMPTGELDLGNVDAFVKAFDGFEKSIVRAHNEMKTGILDEYMSVLEEKKRRCDEKPRTTHDLSVIPLRCVGGWLTTMPKEETPKPAM